MDRITLGKIAIVLSPLLIALPFVFAEEAKYVGEDYYGNDINAAVSEATQNKRQVNYKLKYWYNRTTSKSFDLNPLEKDELEIERLEGALGATAAGGAKNVADPDFPAENHSEQIQRGFLASQRYSESTTINDSEKNLSIINSAPLPIVRLRHEHSKGDIVTTNNIISNGTVTSTPRP
jgi:hypothetical protein